MAYVYDNKIYRNLQQQVKENMDNIAELQDLKLVGIDVAGIVADYSSLPSSAENSSQNETTTVMTAGKLKAYEKLLELLDTDVTGNFISKFKTCFKQFVMPERTWIYATEED